MVIIKEKKCVTLIVIYSVRLEDFKRCFIFIVNLSLKLSFNTNNSVKTGIEFGSSLSQNAFILPIVLTIKNSLLLVKLADFVHRCLPSILPSLL